MRLLLIDDHALIRTGLRMVVMRAFPTADVHEAEDAKSAMAKLSQGPWDMVLVDLDLPDRSGLDLIRDIKALAPKAGILVISGHSERESGRRVLKAGADGFVQKTSHNTDFVAAISRILSGKKYVSADLASEILEAGLGNFQAAAHDSLSARELEVLRCLGKGLTVSDIGRNLGLSVKTVSTYRGRIAEKLGLRNTGELVRYAVQHNIT